MRPSPSPMSSRECAWTEPPGFPPLPRPTPQSRIVAKRSQPWSAPPVGAVSPAPRPSPLQPPLTAVEGLAGSPQETFETLAKLNEDLDPNDMSELAKVARGSVLKHADWVVVNAMRQNMRQKWREFFKTYDVILCPTSITPAFKHNHNPVHERKLTVNGKDDEYLRATLWAGPAVSAGLPSTNVPIGMSSKNLPIGMQITGPYLEDKTCIEVAKIVRDLRGGFKIPPSLQ